MPLNSLPKAFGPWELGNMNWVVISGRRSEHTHWGTEIYHIFSPRWSPHPENAEYATRMHWMTEYVLCWREEVYCIRYVHWVAAWSPGNAIDPVPSGIYHETGPGYILFPSVPFWRYKFIIMYINVPNICTQRRSMEIRMLWDGKPSMYVYSVDRVRVIRSKGTGVLL